MAERRATYTSASSRRAKTLLNMILCDSESHKHTSDPDPKENQELPRVSDAQNMTPKSKADAGGGKTDYINNIYSREYSMTSSVFDQMCETQTTQNSHHLDNLDFTKLNNLSSINNSLITKESESIERNEPIAMTMVDLTCNESFVESPQCELLLPDTSNTVPQEISEDLITYDFDSDDSVLDQNYFPSDSSTSSEEDNIPLNTPSISKKSRKLLTKSRPLQAPVTERQSESEPDTDLCVIKRVQAVKKRRTTLGTLESLKNSSNEGRIVSRKRKNTWNGYLEDVNLTNYTTLSENFLAEIPPKRQKFTSSLAERKQIKNNVKRELYKVKQAGCSNCLKKCATIFDKSCREKINNQYWELSWQERRNFIRDHVSVTIPRKKITTDPKREPRKTYTLKNADGVAIPVCKAFFLTTLGFKKTNDKVLYSSLNHESTRDNRGKHQKTPACNRNLLTEHVESFHPTAPHYRREHAPLRKYIPSDVTITLMHDDFCKKYPNEKVSYELYRSHLKKMNISFTRLGHEECELCEEYDLHKKQTSHDIKKDFIPDCQTCTKYAHHNEKYTKARQLYDLHKKEKQTSSEIFYSTDLEKVIMLPRLDTFKAVVFCNRLTAYNQTFAPLGKITTEFKPLTVLWHDGISGRKQEDIMSAFYCFLLRHRDVRTLHIWLDNCSAQNKNWLLYSFLVHMVNSELISAENIILYYFEPGHTFMSSDQVHHQVELAMKKKQKIYDFTDFEETVGTINNGKVIVHSMTPQSFFNLPNYISERRINNSNPRAYMKNISQVCFQRKSHDLMYKNDFDEDYIVLRFMNDKYLKNPNILNISFRTNPKGVQQDRKTDIIKKLSTIIPAHKMTFWKNLPTTDCDNNINN